MLYVIHALDKPDQLERRLEHYASHKTYLAHDQSELGVRIVISGPLTSEDGQMMIGSLFIIEALDHDAVEHFHQADPFYLAGIWQSVRIHAFTPRQS